MPVRKFPLCSYVRKRENLQQCDRDYIQTPRFRASQLANVLKRRRRVRQKEEKNTPKYTHTLTR